jgi:hypothetical protein
VLALRVSTWVVVVERYGSFCPGAQDRACVDFDASARAEVFGAVEQAPSREGIRTVFDCSSCYRIDGGVDTEELARGSVVRIPFVLQYVESCGWGRNPEANRVWSGTSLLESVSRFPWDPFYFRWFGKLRVALVASGDQWLAARSCSSCL